MATARTSARRRLGAAVAACVMVSAACGSGEADDSAGTTASTLAALDTTVAPTTAGAASTAPTTAPTTAPASVPADLPTDCAWRTPTPGGSVTFVANGRLYESAGDGTVACLTEVTADESGPIRWSPDATRVLLGGSVSTGENGRHATGYFATNPDVTWSAPTGKALIAPSVNDGTLVWRNSTDAGERLDVSFLADTVAATYHPAGKAIAAIGTDENGSTGLYLASNRGEDRKQLTFAEDPGDARLTELAFDADGASVFFLHLHSGVYHVHRLVIDGLVLTDVADEPGAADHLVASTTVDGSVAWQQTDGETHTVRAIFAGGELVTMSGAEATTALEPVGWWGDRLVVLEHENGSTGAGTLWSWSGSEGPVQLAAGVERAATRVERGPFLELPTEITQQAVG